MSASQICSSGLGLAQSTYEISIEVEEFYHSWLDSHMFKDMFVCWPIMVGAGEPKKGKRNIKIYKITSQRFASEPKLDTDTVSKNRSEERHYP